MRLAILTSATSVWGAEHSLRLIAHELVKAGHEVEIACFERAVERFFREADGLSVLHFDRPSSRLRTLMRARRYAVEQEPGTTIILGSLDLLPLAPVIRTGTRSRVIVDLHDYPRQAHIRSVVRVCTRLANGTIAISNFTAKLGPRSGTKVVRRPFLRKAQARPVHKQGSRMRVAVIGRLDRDKDHSVAIDAFSKMSASTELVFIGGPTPGNEEYASSLIAASSVLGDRFSYRGVVETEKVFEDVDVLLVTNRAEAAGRTVVEAMVNRVPVVVPNAGGAAEFVTDGVNGWTYIAGSAQSIADRIELIRALDCSELEVVLQNASVYTLQHEPSAIARQYGAALNELVDKRGQTTP